MTKEEQADPSINSHEHHHHDGCCAPQKPQLRDPLKVGRNDPCICGSGKKFKKCCVNK